MKLLILLSSLLAVSAWADDPVSKVKTEAEVEKEAVSQGDESKRLDADSDGDGIPDVARACGVAGDCDDDDSAAQESAERKARRQDRKTSRD